MIKGATTIPFNHLRECRQLKFLTLVNCSTATDDGEVQLSSSMLSDMTVSTMAYLDALRIWHCEPRLRSMLNALGHSCLSRLTDKNEENAEGIAKMLKVFAPTLQTLEWFACPDERMCQVATAPPFL